MNEIKIDENKEYTREELKTLYEENKETIEFKDRYSEEMRISSFGFLDQTKVLTVKNYPWGFTQKTSVRYWIESTKRGSRFCKQTKNPKTLEWCKPKKSTYDALKFMVINPTGKITTLSLDYNDEERIKVFEDQFTPYLNKLQKVELAKVIGYNEVMKHVSFEVNTQHFKHKITGEISTSINIMEMNQYDRCTKEGELIDVDKKEKERKATEDLINKAMVCESQKAHKVLTGKN